MSEFRRVAMAVVPLVALALLAPESRAAAPVPSDAGKAVTFPFPAKAPVVVQINGLGATRERLHATLKAALPNDAASVDKQIGEGLDLLFAGRKLTAIPKDGRVFVVLHDIAALFENTIAVSVLVPVTSYKEFRETFLTADERKTFDPGKNGVDDVKLTFLGSEHPVHMVDLKEYVAISPDRGTIDTYTQKYTKATTSAMAPELAKTFVTADISLYVNLEVINDLYGNQIRAFKGLVDLAFMQAPMGGMFPGVGKRQLDAVKTMLKGLFQAVEDGRGLLLAVEFRPDGVNLRAQAQFGDDTESVKLLKSESPSSLADVSKLPAGLGHYGGTRLGGKFGEAVAGLNPQFAPADDDEKGNEAVDKHQKELLEGVQTEVSASGTADLSLTVGTYADPKKAVASLVGCYRAMLPGGRVQSVVLKEKPKITEAAKKHQGFTFTEVRLVFDFEATAKDLPEEVKEATLAQLKRQVTEKMTVWVGTDGKAVVQVSAKDFDAASGALDRYLDSKKAIGDTAGYKLTRKNLPPDANSLTLLETGHTANMLADALRSLEGVVPDFPRIGKVKPVKGDPSFIGVAVTLKGDTATLNLFVPGTALAAGHGMLKDMFKKIE